MEKQPGAPSSEKGLSGEGQRRGSGTFLIEPLNQRPAVREASLLHKVFEEIALANPLAVAITCRGQHLSYGELNARANRVAHRLRSLGVGAESLVGIGIGRSPEFIIGLLAIVKAGGAYVPLDLGYPRERLNFMLRDTHPEVVLTGRGGLEADAPWARRMEVTEDVAAFSQESDQNLDVQVGPRNAAYVMYTSGSTGNPKGVVIEQRSILRLALNPNYISISRLDTFLQLAPTSFDASTLEIWGALLNGARLVIPQPGSLNLTEIGKTIEDEKVTILWLTAGLFHAMVDELLTSLAPVRAMLAGGDVLSADHVKRFLEAHRSSTLINGYGPTEGTTFTCCHSLRYGEPIGKTVPIGRPISKTQVLILDGELNQVSIGQPGELYIGGEGVARGYLNQAALTAERFIRNPHSTDPSDVVYRSGDLVSMRADGAIEFLGRKDNQVKIRGFRVELGEIEAVLRQHPAVRGAAAIVVESGESEKTIHAFWTAKAGADCDNGQLLQYAGERLPKFMLPASVKRLQTLPLNENGKVDRKQLLEAAKGNIARQATYVPPSDTLEVELIEIWEEILRTTPIGVRDDFFSLGGHSLLAARMFGRVEERLGKSIPLATMFQAPTIEKLAQLIRAEGWTPHWSVLVPIQQGGSRPPLFLVHGLHGNVLNFYGLRLHIPPDQPLYGLQALGLDSGRAAFASIPEMAAHYNKEIQTAQPNGPYCLGGFSAGGLVAYEMARQLAAAGERVQFLALFDSYIEAAGGYWLKSFYSRSAFRMSMLALRASFASVRRNGLVFVARKKVRNLIINLRIMAWLLRDKAFAGKAGEQPQPGFLSPLEAFTRAIRAYTPQPYAGSAILFRSPSADFGEADLADGWGRHINGKLELQEIRGGHDDIFSEPHIATLADQLMQALTAASGEEAKQQPK